MFLFRYKTSSQTYFIAFVLPCLRQTHRFCGAVHTSLQAHEKLRHAVSRSRLYLRFFALTAVISAGQARRLNVLNTTLQGDVENIRFFS